MHTTTLRKVGGSIMLAVPPALLNVLRMRPGTKVELAVEGGRRGAPRSSARGCSQRTTPIVVVTGA